MLGVEWSTDKTNIKGLSPSMPDFEKAAFM